MNFVFLSPHFPSYYWRFCQRLHRHGVRVLGIGDQPYDALLPELRASLTEYYRVSSLKDYDQLVRACGFFTHKYGRIDRLDSLNEYWLETEAQLRTDFNIYGIKYPDVLTIKEKLRMKETYRTANIPCARGIPVTTLEAAQAFVRAVGFPLIVKPDVGAGARLTRRIDTQEQLLAFFYEKQPCAYLLEEFVPGHVVTFEGINDYEGRVLFATSHVYPNESMMEAVNNGRHIAFHSMLPIEEDVQELGRRVLQVFQTRAHFFHLEFFRLDADKAGLGKHGDLVGMAVNMRVPGGMITDMMNYANDVDVCALWADMIVYGRLLTPVMDTQYICGFASRRDHLPYLHSHADILHAWGPSIQHHLPLPQPMASAMGHYVYLFRAPQLDSIHEITAYIQATDDKNKLPHR